MTARVKDKYGRWRSKTVAFRMSEAESDALDTMVTLSGLTKQDYIISKLLNKDVVVRGNPRVFKLLKTQLEKIHSELRRINETDGKPSPDLLETVRTVSAILERLCKEESA